MRLNVICNEKFGKEKTSHFILVINYLQESFSCLTQEYICKHNSSCLENKSLSFFPTFDLFWMIISIDHTSTDQLFYTKAVLNWHHLLRVLYNRQ